MSKAVMLSIRPKWCEKIASGEKTIEVRKTRPKIDTPFKCYIYCTIGGQDLNIPISQERLMRDYLETGSMKSLNCPLGNGKVIGEFTCDRIYELETKARGGSYYVIDFYKALGFEIAFRTVNEEADEEVAFLKLNTLVVETYENKAAKMEAGAIDHMAIDVKDIEKVYEMINQAGLNTTNDTVHFLPFWENGVKFFTIEGPNKEKVEFSQYL